MVSAEWSHLVSAGGQADVLSLGFYLSCCEWDVPIVWREPARMASYGTCIHHRGCKAQRWYERASKSTNELPGSSHRRVADGRHRAPDGGHERAEEVADAVRVVADERTAARQHEIPGAFGKHAPHPQHSPRAVEDLLGRVLSRTRAFSSGARPASRRSARAARRARRTRVEALDRRAHQRYRRDRDQLADPRQELITERLDRASRSVVEGEEVELRANQGPAESARRPPPRLGLPLPSPREQPRQCSTRRSE